MPDIRVYFSFRSPYSRLGLHLIDRAGLDVELIPFTGPPDGAPFVDPSANPAKLSYYMQDVPRMTMRMGLPIARPDPFEIDLSPSYKAAIAASRDGVGLPYALNVSDARWGEGKNVSDMDVLKACAEQVGWSGDAVEKAQTDLSVGKALKQQRELIETDQIFGVPFAVMGEQKYWGHDRFELLIADAA